MIICFMNQYEFGTSMKRHGESEVMGVWSMEVGLVSLFLHQNPSCFSKPINLSNPDLPRTLHDFPIFQEDSGSAGLPVIFLCIRLMNHDGVRVFPMGDT